MMIDDDDMLHKVTPLILSLYINPIFIDAEELETGDWSPLVLSQYINPTLTLNIYSRRNLLTLH